MVQEKEYSVRRCEQAAELLPLRLRRMAMELPAQKKAVAEEFRLRVGRPATVLLPEGEVLLAAGVRESVVSADDLERMVGAVTEYARYASSEMLKNGYLTVRGGFRLGLCGTAVMRDGRSCSMRDFSSAALRIAKPVCGIADSLIEMLFEDGRLQSTLILSAPGGGKTTLLRDVVRCISDGGGGREPLRVALVDERGEIAAVQNGTAQMEVGAHTDVLDGCLKSIGVTMMLRAMNPQVIAVDEISARADTEVMIQAANCGVALLATAHAADVEELRRRGVYAPLLAEGIFRRVVTIRRADGERVYEAEAIPC